METVRLTTLEAAKILGIDESLVRRYCRDGLLGERIGRNFSITDDDLRRFMKRREERPKRGRPYKQPISRIA
jgi:predicted site-specific integrase-resolvase